MNKRYTLIISIVLLIVLLSLEISLSWVPMASAGEWLPWACGWTVVNYPVGGGYLSGRSCRQFYSGPQLWWRVWGDTYAPQSATIYTYVSAWDSCNGGATWTVQMIAYNYNSNTTYGTSGPAVQGNFLNCGPTDNHVYRNEGVHRRRNTPTSPWEGSSGYW